MPNLAEYFARNRPEAQWSIGDRVQGLYNGIPFIGSVGSEVMRNEEEGPMASVHLDLPIKHDDVWKTIIRVSPQSLQSRDTGP